MVERTHDYNEEAVIAITAPEKTTKQQYKCLHPRPRGWYDTSSGTST